MDNNPESKLTPEPSPADMPPAVPPTAPPADPAPDPAPDPEGDEPEGDDPDETFPREYVERLRGESHRYRKRAQTAETRTTELSAALWTARVAGTDRLADPADLPLPDDTDPLDADALDAAVAELLAAKPHLAARRARGDVGAHQRRETAPPSLASMLRANT